VHGGGYLGAYSGRVDHAWGARLDCRAALSHPPTHYLKKVFVDTVVFTPHQLAAIIDLFGADHVVVGTDYPFDMAESDPLGHLATVEAFEPVAIAGIAGLNAKKLLGL
jgi:aminocarboxymuconate-semialdehyde decarboxylase